LLSAPICSPSLLSTRPLIRRIAMSVIAGTELLQKRTWAVVGDVLNTNKPAGQIVQRLRNHNKTVYLINPRAPDADKHVYASVSELAGKNVDVLDMVVNPRAGAGMIDAARQVGIRHFFLQPGADGDAVVETIEQHKDLSYHKGCVLREMLPEQPAHSSNL